METSPPEPIPANSTQQRRYWNFWMQLLTHARYVQYQLEREEKIVSHLDSFTALATSGSIGAWLVWQGPTGKNVWAVIAAMSQVLLVVRKYLPNDTRVKLLRDGAAAFKLLEIECESKIHTIYDGQLSDNETNKLIAGFQKEQHRIEERMYAIRSDTLNAKNWERAQQHADDYAKNHYGQT